MCCQCADAARLEQRASKTGIYSTDLRLEIKAGAGTLRMRTAKRREGRTERSEGY